METHAGDPVQPDVSATDLPGHSVASSSEVRLRGEVGLRLLVVSHPAVVSVNQEVYLQLLHRGWDVTIVVPSRWPHEYSAGSRPPEVLQGMEGCLCLKRVALGGRPQRHFYLARCSALVSHLSPDVAFVEAEPFSIAALQWARALKRSEIPFGVQSAENIDRRLPPPVRWWRSLVLRDAAFVAARSVSAGQMARKWGARGQVALAPHAVPAWEVRNRSPSDSFTVGYAGRLVESKGLFDLLAAVRKLDAPVELLLIGSGELRGQLEGQPIPGSRVRVIDDLAHSEMAAGYAQLDVLVLPSRTTPTWKEQFGRVAVEAMWCGVPVVGSDSGEIPWLLKFTGGGTVFPEGDSAALASELSKLRADPALRSKLAASGRRSVEKHFSLRAATDALEHLLLRAHAQGRGVQPSPLEATCA